MLNSILDTVNTLLPAKRKTNSTSGWTSFNAVCCHNRGETQDTRGRGGIITNPNGAISYSCFNCNYTANYTPGRHLNYKFRKLLSWLGADDNTVKRLVIDAIRIKELVEPEKVEEVKEEIVFKPRPLPAEAQTFHALETFHKLSDNADTPIHHEPGDLYVTINIAQHAIFKRDRVSLQADLNIDAIDAILGHTYDFNCIDGSKIRIDIPAGTQHGSMLRVQGKGMPAYQQPNKRGDMFITVSIVVPKDLSDIHVKALKKIAASRRK